MEFSEFGSFFLNVLERSEWSLFDPKWPLKYINFWMMFKKCFVERMHNNTLPWKYDFWSFSVIWRQFDLYLTLLTLTDLWSYWPLKWPFLIPAWKLLSIDMRNVGFIVQNNDDPYLTPNDLSNVDFDIFGIFFWRNVF